MAVRSKVVLQVLNQCHGGILRAVDTDAATKLLRSMHMRDGLRSELCERLVEMADTNQVVISCEGNRFNLIATPEALAAEADATDEGSTTVPTPRGARLTTRARTGDGKDLPAHLRDEHVGPLLVRYKDPEAGEAIATAAELVFEEAGKSGKRRYGRDELLATIQGLLLPLYDDKAEVAQTLAMPVLGFWVDNGFAKRVNVPGPGRRRDEIIIELALPETAEAEVAEVASSAGRDPIELLALLAPQLEAAKARVTELEQLVEGAVDPEVVAKIVAKAEELQRDKEGLQRELQDAGTEKERIVAAHKGQVTKLRTDHRAALTKLRGEHEAALAALQQKLDAALAENEQLQSAAQRRNLPPELQRQVDKLLGQ